MVGISGSLPIAGQDVAETAEHRALFSASSSGLRRGCNDAARHADQRQRLQPNAAGTAPRREKETFTAEYCGLDPADILDVVVNGRLKCDKTARIQSKQFAGRRQP